MFVIAKPCVHGGGYGCVGGGGLVVCKVMVGGGGGTEGAVPSNFYNYFVSGGRCETNINDCDPDPCNHGNCVDLIDGYVCHCDPGYTGTHCEVHCKNMPSQ